MDAFTIWGDVCPPITEAAQFLSATARFRACHDGLSYRSGKGTVLTMVSHDEGVRESFGSPHDTSSFNAQHSG